MIPSITAVRLTGSAHRSELPLLVLGPAPGTSATALWSECAAGLTGAFDVLAWDLPGHGHNTAVPEEPFSMVELAGGVLAVVEDVLVQRAQADAPFFYAGVGAGGAVGLQLLLDAPSRVAAAVLLGTGARIEGGSELGEVAGLDVSGRLAEIGVPVLAVAGSRDVEVPAASLREIADGVQDGRFVELPGVAHLAPAEAPLEVARLLREHFLGETEPDSVGTGAEDFAQALADSVRAAVADGVGVEEIRAALLQAATLCGAPGAGAGPWTSG